MALHTCTRVLLHQQPLLLAPPYSLFNCRRLAATIRAVRRSSLCCWSLCCWSSIGRASLSSSRGIDCSDGPRVLVSGRCKGFLLRSMLLLPPRLVRFAASVRVEVVLLLLPETLCCCANLLALELIATPVPRFKKFFWHPAAYLPSLDVRCFTTPAPALECAVGPAALPNRTSLALSFRGFNPILRRTLSGSALLGIFARGILKSNVEPAEHTKPLALRHPDILVAVSTLLCKS